MLKETKEENKPKYLFIENVKNLLSVNKGWDFYNLLYTLDETGFDAEWQLFNSKDFGVPQNRERIFIIGHSRRRSTRKVFPIISSNSKTLIKIIDGAQGNRVYDPKGLSVSLQGQSGGMGAKTGLYLVNKSYGQWKLRKNHLSTCLDTHYNQFPDNHGARTGVLEVKAVLTPNREHKRQHGRRFKDSNEPMFTLTKNDIHGVYIKESTKQCCSIAHEGDSINLSVPDSTTRCGRVEKEIANTLDTQCNQSTLVEGRIRRLTPRECFRLQGFPNEYFDRAQKVCSDSQLYKQAGNSVSVPVIYQIAKKLY